MDLLVNANNFIYYTLASCSMEYLIYFLNIMEECIVCGYKAYYLCISCKGSFCNEHKSLHEQNKNKIHVFETIGKRIESNQARRIIESLMVKINTIKELKRMTMLETKAIIRKIMEMCMESIKCSEVREKYYMNLLKIAQDSLTDQDLKALEDQLAITLAFNVPAPSFREMQDFYDGIFLQETNNFKFSAQRLEHLRSMPLNNLKQVLAEEYNLLLERHTGEVLCLALTIDNKYIISGSRDKTIRIWDFQLKTQECVLRGHNEYILSVAVTRDNRYIVSGSFDHTIRIWDFQNKEQVAILEGHTKYVVSVVITTDNKYIASGSGDTHVRLWDFQNKNIYAVLQGHSQSVFSVAVTSDSRHVVSGSEDKTVRIWSIQGKIIESILEGHSMLVSGVAITSDNSCIITTSGDKSLGIWNFQRKNLEAVLHGHTKAVRCLTISCDNLYAISGSDDRTIRIWNLKEKRQETIINDDNAIKYCVVVTVTISIFFLVL